MSYEVLRIIWWVLLGVLLCGFAIMDGFDLGVAALVPFVGRNDVQRRIIINTVGPVWEGNQVWLILGGGAIFAAWPMLYAVAFSGFYFAMLLVLLVVGIIRPVSFKYRSKLVSVKWRYTWDALLSFSGIVGSLLFGVAVGNAIVGVPFHFDQTLRIYYTGTFWGLLNPFSIACGLVCIFMVLMHGGLYLATKTEDPIQLRAAKYSRISAILLVIFFTICGFWVAYGIDGYVITKSLGHLGPSNPLHKTVIKQQGAWLHNYSLHPWMLLAPIMAYAGVISGFITNCFRFYRTAFLLSTICVFGIVTTAGVSIFPFLLPSSSNPSMSLSVWDASSSKMTLVIMLVATAIFLPLILAYTAWVYRILRGKVTQSYIETNDQATY
jgi:cytochrome bd ubiquinol oxidase subunit II